MSSNRHPNQKKGNYIYSYAFKKMVVDQIQNGLISKRQAGFKYLVSPSTIQNWCKTMGNNSKTKSDKDEIKRLKAKIEELELQKALQQEVFIEVENLGGGDYVKKLLPKQLYNELQEKKKQK